MVLALLLAGCGVTIQRPGTDETEWMSKPEFRAYAKTVLQRQNDVENELMFLLPELQGSDPERYRRLTGAEDRLLDACQPLVESALKRRRGTELGLLERLHLPRHTTACDRQTRHMERMLAE